MRGIRLRIDCAAVAAIAAGALFAIGLPAAHASPTEPLFVAAIDDYSDYQGQTTCVDHVQPGVADFRTVVLPAYPGTGYGQDIRACDQGGQSEHKDGRAWDWTIPDGHQGDAENLLAWLIKPDSYGNKNAMIRRLGIMYIIWNRQVWRAYDPGKGWQPYDGADPHTSHVHFSFGWDGALEKTSWFTGTTKGLLLDQAGYGADWRDKGHLELVRRAEDGEVERRVWDRGWSGWESLEGDVDSAPAEAWTSRKNLWVAALSGKSLVVRRWQASKGWSPWQTLKGEITSGVGLAASKGRLDVFGRSASGSAVQRTWSHGKWSDWVDLGGGITAPPAAVWRAPGVLDVFVRGNTGGMYQNTWQDDAWSGWTGLGGPYSSGPATASLAPGEVDLFARSANGTIATRHFGEEWSDWSDLGGFHSSAPTADAVRGVRLDVFTQRPDGVAAQNSYAPGSGWTGWIVP